MEKDNNIITNNVFKKDKIVFTVSIKYVYALHFISHSITRKLRTKQRCAYFLDILVFRKNVNIFVRYFEVLPTDGEYGESNNGCSLSRTV